MVGVAPVTSWIREQRLQWHGQIMRRWKDSQTLLKMYEATRRSFEVIKNSL